MTNREQVAWTLSFAEYEDCEVADILSDMVSAIGGSIYFERDRLTQWLGLECDPVTNNWGELEWEDGEEDEMQSRN